ncbi:uncharacterized protein TNCV_4048361 [Trichonephila clavipes]|nr:uncharacterized protein TNCV_4048361 [Trichonephila clavipes]
MPKKSRRCHAQTVFVLRSPPKPSGMPLLDPISIRLISPWLPFMQIRRLRYEGNYGIVGQVINVPVDVSKQHGVATTEADRRRF